MLFENSFLKMNLPPGWSCISNTSGTTWICQSADEKVKSDSMIVLASRPAQIPPQGTDSLEHFSAALSSPKKSEDAEGKPLISTVQFNGRLKMSGLEWIDSTHSNSELKGFHTRYLMTVSEGNAVGLTLSVHSPKLAEYRSVFEEIIKSVELKKVQISNLQANTNMELPASDGSVVAPPIDTTGDRLPQVNIKGGAEDRALASSSMGSDQMSGTLWIAAGVVMGLVALGLLRKRLRNEDE